MKLLAFFETINKAHPCLKSDFKYSYDTIEFIDTKIYRNKNDTLRLTLYWKPTDRQNLLHFNSAHPYPLKKISYSQELCIKKTCTEDTEATKNQGNLKDGFLKLGYGENFLKEWV